MGLLQGVAYIYTYVFVAYIPIVTVVVFNITQLEKERQVLPKKGFGAARNGFGFRV